MTSEKWKQVEALFEQTLEAAAAERPQFLHNIGDDELRREVESLLEAHQQAGGKSRHFFVTFSATGMS